jgi:hypothetical protein
MQNQERAWRLVIRLLAFVVCIASTAYAQTTAPHHDVQLPQLNWTPRSDWINVVAAGAKGNGTTDDADAIQHVLDRLSDKRPAGQPRGHVVYFPPGRYRITRTLTITQSTGDWLVGHGRTTTILWDGEIGGRMYWSNGCRHVCYEGLTWDGQGKAAILVQHQSQSYYETWIRYLHCAFVNAREHGIVVGLGDAKSPSAEIWFRDCLFDHCAAGVSLLAFNDYDNIFDGCEFDHCGIGVHAIRGNWQIRGCRFQASAVSDVKQDDISHGSSLRLCVSSGSRRFLETPRSGNPMPIQIQGCRVEGWTAPDGAVVIGHPGPVTMFDCVFANPPNQEPPVVLAATGNAAQSLIVSCNQAPPGVALARAGPKVLTTEIPAGERKPVAPPTGQRVLCEQVRIPGKVFDAKADFGAKGDGKSDDTLALQHCIDAARQSGNDAIAYLPGGDYSISQTLSIAGSHYFVGGIGTMATVLRWKGAAGGTAIHVDNPQDIVVEDIDFEGRDDSYTRIRQTGGGPSSILYDQIAVSHYNDPLDGLICENLPAAAKVRFGLFNGKLRLHDCGQADIFALIHYNVAILDGAELPKTGFTGLMFHNAAFPSYALAVSDNQDVVVGDYYMEQSTHFLLCAGGGRAGAGHVTIGASKLSAKDIESVTVHDYEGRIWIGGGDVQNDIDRLKTVHFKQEGSRPLWFISAGNAWAASAPILDFDRTANFVQLGDVVGGKHFQVLPNQVPPGAMPEAAGALDDLRRLATVYLDDVAGKRP